jgi:hypothetical protein
VTGVPLKDLALELRAFQGEALRDDDELAATTIGATALLASLGDEYALVTMAGHLGAADVTLLGGTDRHRGLLIRAARAILCHIGTTPRRALPPITHAVLLQTVGALAVDRDRLEREVIDLQHRLAAANDARARAERAAAAARAEGETTAPEGSIVPPGDGQGSPPP